MLRSTFACKNYHIICVASKILKKLNASVVSQPLQYHVITDWLCDIVFQVKFDVHRVDNMVIQSIALLDQLDKDINTFGMRIREW